VFEQHKAWQQAGGCLDWDGNVGLEVVQYILRFRPRFSDLLPQMEKIKSFMNHNKVTASAIKHVMKGSMMLQS
jgi:hypothetical protein